MAEFTNTSSNERRSHLEQGHSQHGCSMAILRRSCLATMAMEECKEDGDAHPPPTVVPAPCGDNDAAGEGIRSPRGRKTWVLHAAVKGWSDLLGHQRDEWLLGMVRAWEDTLLTLRNPLEIKPNNTRRRSILSIMNNVDWSGRWQSRGVAPPQAGVLFETSQRFPYAPIQLRTTQHISTLILGPCAAHCWEYGRVLGSTTAVPLIYFLNGQHGPPLQKSVALPPFQAPPSHTQNAPCKYNLLGISLSSQLM